MIHWAGQTCKCNMQAHIFAPVLTVTSFKLMSGRVYPMLVRLFVNGRVIRSSTVGIEFRAYATE